MNAFDTVTYTFFFIVLIFLFFKFFLVLLLIAVLLGFFRTWSMKQEPNYKEFLQGKLPNPKPDGFYHGDTGFNTSWIGKKFDAPGAKGVNIFKNKKGQEVEKYSFVTSVGKGLFSDAMFVLKIDYNVKGNPFWIRCILDEIVQVHPNEYLGNMQLRIIPGFPFSILYFQLKK